MHVPRTSAIRALDAAVELVNEREQQLCQVIESSQSSPQEKYQALVDLAYMTAILVRETTETSED
jgi:hypothetical protein